MNPPPAGNTGNSTGAPVPTITGASGNGPLPTINQPLPTGISGDDSDDEDEGDGDDDDEEDDEPIVNNNGSNPDTESTPRTFASRPPVLAATGTAGAAEGESLTEITTTQTITGTTAVETIVTSTEANGQLTTFTSTSFSTFTSTSTFETTVPTSISSTTALNNNTPLIAGATTGACAFLVALLIAFICLRRRRRSHERALRDTNFVVSPFTNVNPNADIESNSAPYTLGSESKPGMSMVSSDAVMITREVELFRGSIAPRQGPALSQSDNPFLSASERPQQQQPFSSTRNPNALPNPFEAPADQDKALFDRNTYDADVNPFMDPPRLQLVDTGSSRLSMRSLEDRLAGKRGSAGDVRNIGQAM